MKNTNTLLLLLVVLLVRSDCMDAQHLSVKKKRYVAYMTTNGKTIKTHGQYIYLSALKNTLHLNTIDGTNGPRHTVGGIMVSESRGGVAHQMNTPPNFTISAGWHTDDHKNLPFSDIIIGINKYTYQQMIKNNNGQQISSYDNGPIGQYTKLFNQSRQPVVMNDSMGKSIFQTTLYLPSILDVTGEPDYDSSQSMPSIDMHKGIALHWNADSSNPNGIIIVLKEALLDGKLSRQTYIFTLPDNGTFMIGPKYLLGFLADRSPGQKYIRLEAKIYRGDSQEVKGTDGRKYGAEVYSRWNAFFTLQ
jgi:hypothetical protein